MLRQELVVLRRQVPHPKTCQEERLVLTALQRLRAARVRLSNLFTPDTLRRWQRELVNREVALPPLGRLAPEGICSRRHLTPEGSIYLTGSLTRYDVKGPFTRPMA